MAHRAAAIQTRERLKQMHIRWQDKHMVAEVSARSHRRRCQCGRWRPPILPAGHRVHDLGSLELVLPCAICRKKVNAAAMAVVCQTGCCAAQGRTASAGSSTYTVAEAGARRQRLKQHTDRSCVRCTDVDESICTCTQRTTTLG